MTVDLQHGMFGVDTSIGMLQAISAQSATQMVRVPALDDASIMQMLDAGAYGVICPMINTADLGIPIGAHPLPSLLDEAVDRIIGTAHEAGYGSASSAGTRTWRST